MHFNYLVKDKDAEIDRHMLEERVDALVTGFFQNDDQEDKVMYLGWD